MSRASPILTNFTAGELSPRLAGRIDLGRYRNGARRLENVIVHPHGGVSRRPGTRFVAPTQFCARKARLVPFVFSAQQAHVLEFGHHYIRVFDQGAPVPGGGGMAATATPINRLAGELVSGHEGGGEIENAANAFSGTTASSDYFHAGGIGREWTCDNTKAVARFRVEIYHNIPTGVVGWKLQGSQDGMAWDDLTSTSTALDVTVAEVDRQPYAWHRIWFDFGVDGTDNYRAVRSIEFFGPGVYEITTPYEEAQLPALQFAQSADVLFITHPDHPPMKLNRYGIDQWELVDFPFTRGPFLDTVISSDSSKVLASAGTLSSHKEDEPAGAIANAARAFDENTGNSTASFKDGWLRKDWGGGTSRRIARYRLTVSSFGFDMMLEGSNNGSSWTELDTLSRPEGIQTPVPIEVNAGIDTLNAYRYHRFSFAFKEFQGGP